MAFTYWLPYFQVEVHHARSIIEVFDDISYKKGSAVIRMLQGYLGDLVFQVRVYVLNYRGVRLNSYGGPNNGPMFSW